MFVPPKWFVNYSWVLLTLAGLAILYDFGIFKF